MIGSLILGGIIIISNFKVLFDSNSLNLYAVLVNFMCTLSFFILFYNLSGNELNDLNHHF